MKEIHFKNGEIVKVSQEIVEIIAKRLLEEGCSIFQIISNEDEETEFIINIFEINFIK